MESMTVKELKEQLAEIPDDTMLVVLTDSKEVCFPVASVGVKEMQVLDSSITGAVGFLYRDTDGVREHIDVCYIGNADGYEE